MTNGTPSAAPDPEGIVETARFLLGGSAGGNVSTALRQRGDEICVARSGQPR